MPSASPRPRPTIVLAALAVGMAVGVAVFTFSYGEGASYLRDDPSACANCHIMTAQYTGWLTGSHRNAATCNDCHTPKAAVGKYATKASNGFWHSFYFTTGRFHEPILIKAGNRRITERRCRECHASLTHAIVAAGREAPSCLSCHPSVGHRR